MSLNEKDMSSRRPSDVETQASEKDLAPFIFEKGIDRAYAIKCDLSTSFYFTRLHSLLTFTQLINASKKSMLLYLHLLCVNLTR